MDFYLVVFYLFVSTRGVLSHEDVPFNKTEYNNSFDKGYFPFEDNSTVAPWTVELLDRRDYCNRIFSNHIEQNSLLLQRTPPTVPTKVSVLFIFTVSSISSIRNVRKQGGRECRKKNKELR